MLRPIVLSLFAVAALSVAFLFYKKMQPQTDVEKHETWRRMAIESEGKSRPPEYESLKFKNESIEIRQPASKK